ncbi:hypothetical protein ACN28I_30625 [Archangium gephyra]|uniref:hypothetical protein n=1 Tax=Archangium gephyra TaxID=48 RepID=UPI003B7DEE0C
MEEREPFSLFSLLRCLVAVVTSGVGMGLGAWLGLAGGSVLDDALGDLLGGGTGFVPIGNLMAMLAVLATPLGAVLGALWGHSLLSGRGSFRAGLGAALVGLVPCLLVSLSVRGLVFPLLLLLPVAVAVGLELSNKASG